MDSAVRPGREDPTRPGAHRIPVRTCVGCRRRDEQHALLRVVATQEAATDRWLLGPDPRRRGQGRGAYVHPDLECLRTATTRRAFGRALRLPVGTQIDAGAVQDWVQQQSGQDTSSGRVVRPGRHQGGPEEPVCHRGSGSGTDADEHPMSTQQ
ncbi:MAG: YlxR family protein [Brachybacterium sp.]|nr:YlxR family protein [Brachybacterium sp.]